MSSPPVINQTWYVRPPGVPEAVSAGGVVARRDGDRIWIAMAREGSRDDFILPKGHVEGGESLEATATREIYEEAGFSEVLLLGKLGVVERLDFARTEWKRIHFYLFATRQVDVVPGEGWRHKPPQWADLDDLPPMFWPDQIEMIEDTRATIREKVMRIAWE